MVIPVRNRSATIGRCLAALAAQDYPQEATEVIVVDNGSTDDTRAIVAAYGVTLLVESEIRTSYAARNRGIRHARGELVAFLDSDCVAAPEWLSQLVSAFDDEQRIAAVVGAIDDAPATTLCEEFTARLRPFARPLRRGLATLLTANVAIRRDALEAVGLFDESLPTAGDVDLGWRLQQQLGVVIAENLSARVQHIHRSTFLGIFRQYCRYGASEILLTTLHRGGAGSLSFAEHARRMRSQLRAIATYIVSLACRAVASPFRLRSTRRRYILWPLFLLTAETGNVAGKCVAFVRTRGCRRNPYRNGREITRPGGVCGGK
ncbi:MAG TPA: glycosyltransferase [Thermoanaerobaculia bacterium]|nr:glycosyltransferase [Thermoanaerobaculia bacterium]